MPIDDDRLNKAQVLLTEAQALQAMFVPAPKPMTKDVLLLIILNEIPLFNRLLNRLNTTTAWISKLIKKTGDASTTVLNAAKVSPFVGIALNIVDFIQIPLIYLAAFALGEKAPISLSNNARWLYAGVLLALCLAAFFIPVAAPFIAIASASLGFLAGVFTLGKLLHEYNADKNSLKKIKEQINTGSAGQLDSKVVQLNNARNNPETNIELMDQLIIDIERLNKECDKQKEDIKTLYEKAYLLEEKLNLEVDVMDNCIGIALSSSAVVGTVLSLFFPPIGLIILLTTSIAGAAYITGRIIYNHSPALQKEPVVTVNLENDTPDLPRKPAAKGSTHHLLKKFSLGKKDVPSTGSPEKSQSISKTERKPTPEEKQNNSDEDKSINLQSQSYRKSK